MLFPISEWRRLTGFETARMVFDDPLAINRPDGHPDGDRWQTIGSVKTILLFVVHTWPEIDPQTGEEPAGSSAHAKRRRMKGELMSKGNSKPLTSEQAAELAALAALTDDQINTCDIPEQKDWRGARRGLFFRPIKKQLTLRLDADVIDWLKTHAENGEGYQTSINSALRAYVNQHSDE